MNALILRLSIPILLVILALIAFKSGVKVEYRPELSDQPVGILVFHIVSFFTFGAKDYGSPVEGPLFWQYVIYFVYYAAPLNFLSVLAEAVYLLSRPLLPLLLYKKKHYLIIGYGRVGKAAADFIMQSHDKGSRIVILDNNENELPTGFNLFRWKKLFLNRDMNDAKALDDLRLNHCKGVFILTDNEWLNIKLYYDIRSKLNSGGKDAFIFTRVSSIDLMNHLNSKKMEGQQGSEVKLNANDYFFNIHSAASQQLFDENKNAQLEKEVDTFENWKKGSIESVIFFGFGRFGSSFFNQLQSDLQIRNTLEQIIIVDPRAEESWRYFQSDYPVLVSIKPTVIKANMENLALLESEFSKLDLGHSLAVFGSDNEITNIRYATAFHKIFDKKDSLHYILRTMTRMNFSKEVLDNFLGKNYILIPTFDWVRAYFEDEFKKLGKS